MYMYKYVPYSYSKLNLFQQCPFAWKCSYIDHIPAERHSSLIIGDLVHRIVARYLRVLSQNKEQTNHSLLDRIVNRFLEEYPHYEEELIQYIPGIKNIAIPPIPPIKINIEAQIGVDTEFKPVPYDSSAAFLRGKIDFYYMIESSLVVIDWKTNRNLPDQEVISKDRQTHIYALMVQSLNPEIERFIVELSFLKYGVVRKVELSYEHLETAKNWVVEIVKKIEAEKDFEPTPGEHCNFCSYVSHCPVVKPAIKGDTRFLPAKITSQKQAEKLAGMLKVLDRTRTKLQELLKEWVREKGPVDISGERLNFHTYDTYTWDTPEAKAALSRVFVQAGVSKTDIWELFSTNKTTVCNFLRKHRLKDLTEKALATGKKGSSEKFCFKKRKEGGKNGKERRKHDLLRSSKNPTVLVG